MRRVVVDTNVIISATLNPQGAPAAVLAALLDGRFLLITSQPMVDEFSEVLARPRISQRRGLEPAWIERVRAALLGAPDRVPVLGTLRLCRDPDDDIVLETAMRGGADTLVSRDGDLTRSPDLTAALARQGVAIMTVRQFLDSLAANQHEPGIGGGSR